MPSSLFSVVDRTIKILKLYIIWQMTSYEIIAAWLTVRNVIIPTEILEQTV